jgi:hypothetical protein
VRDNAEEPTVWRDELQGRIGLFSSAALAGDEAGGPRDRASATLGVKCRGVHTSHAADHIWEFAPKRYPEISSLILRYPKISLNSNKSKDMFYGYERISLTG